LLGLGQKIKRKKTECERSKTSQEISVKALSTRSFYLLVFGVVAAGKRGIEDFI